MSSSAGSSGYVTSDSGRSSRSSGVSSGTTTPMTELSNDDILKAFRRDSQSGSQGTESLIFDQDPEGNELSSGYDSIPTSAKRNQEQSGVRFDPATSSVDSMSSRSPSRDSSASSQSEDRRQSESNSSPYSSSPDSSQSFFRKNSEDSREKPAASQWRKREPPAGPRQPIADSSMKNDVKSTNPLSAPSQASQPVKSHTTYGPPSRNPSTGPFKTNNEGYTFETNGTGTTLHDPTFVIRGDGDTKQVAPLFLIANDMEKGDKRIITEYDAATDVYTIVTATHAGWNPSGIGTTNVDIKSLPKKDKARLARAKKVRTLMSSIVGPGHDPLNNTFDYTSEIASKLRSVPEEEWATLNFELSEEDAKGRISDLDDYAKRWRESPRLKDVDSDIIRRTCRHYVDFADVGAFRTESLDEEAIENMTSSKQSRTPASYYRGTRFGSYQLSLPDSGTTLEDLKPWASLGGTLTDDEPECWVTRRTQELIDLDEYLRKVYMLDSESGEWKQHTLEMRAIDSGQAKTYNGEDFLYSRESENGGEGRWMETVKAAETLYENAGFRRRSRMLATPTPTREWDTSRQQPVTQPESHEGAP